VKDDLKKEVIKCICGEWTKPKIFHIEGFDVRGSECSKCGEAYLNGEDAYKLSEFRKVKDAILEGKISKSGNSYVVRLPIDVIKALGLKLGEKVKLSVKNPHEIVISV
jgi:hypothetical protein